MTYAVETRNPRSKQLVFLTRLSMAERASFLVIVSLDFGNL